MLEVSHFTKRYGKTVACDDLSFRLPDGSVTVLLGPNGAGKSTLMKGIIGFLRFEGRVLVNGASNTAPQSRRAIGYIPEIPSFYPNLTVEEHMEFLARAYRLRDYRERAEALLRRFSLDEHRTKLGSELSKGLAQKLNICLGLLTGPSVVLLDEPFIGLDPHAIKELKNTVEELRARGASLLLFFQVPLMMRRYGIDVWAALSVPISWCLTLGVSILLKILIYEFGSTHPFFRRNLRWFILGGLALMGFLFYRSYQQSEEQVLLLSAHRFFNLMKAV